MRYPKELLMLKSSLFGRASPAWAMLSAGILATVFASLQVKRGIEQEVVRQFAFVCDQVTFEVRERLDAYALILRGGAALFAASKEVERDQWRAYVETLRAQGSIPGVQGIGFAQVIPAHELASHIARVRAEGFPDYTVSPVGERASYTSIIYLEPFRDRNLRALGYDMFSEPVRRAAMEQARDSGAAALSGKVRLVQETATEVQAGTLMYVPIYRNGLPSGTLEQRRAALVGWAYSPYRMNDLMTGILRDWELHEGQTVDLQIYDGLQATPASLLFDGKTSHVADLHSLFYQQRSIDFNGHKWLLVFDRTLTPSGINYTGAWAALIGGLALSGLLFGLMLSRINTRTNAVRIANELTEEIKGKSEALKESEHSLKEAQSIASVGSYVLDGPTGLWKSSDVCDSLFGIDAAYGHSMAGWQALIHPDDRSMVADYFNGQIVGRNQIFDKEYRIVRHNDQAERWIHALGALKFDGHGALQKIVGTIQDITERKQAAEELSKSEADLRSLIEQSPIAMIVDVDVDVDADEKIVMMNHQFTELFGYTREDVPDARHWWRLAYPDEKYRQEMVTSWTGKVEKAIQSHSQIEPMEATVTCKDGSIRYVRFSLASTGSRNIIAFEDLTTRKQNELALARTNRALRTLGACNEALVHAENETELLDAVCRLVVDTGGYRMAWVGFPEQNAAKSVRPVAHYGYDQSFLASAKISWADNEESGSGATGTALRTGTVQINQDFLTNPALAPWREAALQRGYQSSIALPLKSATATLGVLSLYTVVLDAFTEVEVALLQELAEDLAFGIETLRTRAERDRIAHEQLHHTEILRQSLEDSIKAIANTVEMRDPYTAGHQRRVGQLAVAIARELGLSEDTIRGIELAASIHDLGKISVPAEILSKPGKLTAIEFMLLKNHAQAGFDILKDIKFPWPIATMVLQHHERQDGSGYPQGLKGEQILPESRIMMVADVVEAMASHRPYRPALGIDSALKEIERGRGTAYDAVVVDACIRLFSEKRFLF